jgi:hypothetical protein
MKLVRAAWLALLALVWAYPATAAGTREWYYAANGAATGPFDLDEMTVHVAAGTVRTDTQTYVARNGWRPAREHPELSGFFAGAGAPPPSPPPPPPPAAGDLDARAKAFLVGTWRQESQNQGGGTAYRNVVDVTYLTDGTLHGVVTVTDLGTNFASSGQMEGTFAIKALDTSTMTVTTQARLVPGPGGASTYTESSTFKVIDKNTLERVPGGSRLQRIR